MAGGRETRTRKTETRLRPRALLRAGPYGRLVPVSGACSSTRPSRQVSGTGGSRFSVLSLCHVRPEPEHGDQSWVAEGGDPADARAGDGAHADSVRLLLPLLSTGLAPSATLPFLPA